MAQELFSSNGYGQLNGAVTSAATSLTVVSSANFPAAATGTSQFRVRINNELLIVTNVSGTTWTVTRGAEGTTAQAHNDGDAIVLILTAQSIQNLAGGVNAQTGTSYTIATTDNRQLVTFSNAGAIAVTLPQATSGDNSNFGPHFWFAFRNLGAGVATITPTISTIDGASSLAVRQGMGGIIYSDGTNYGAIVIGDVAHGGTGRATLTANSILLGEGTSPVNQLVLTNGQLPIGSTSADPVAATLTASATAGSKVVITNAPGSITIGNPPTQTIVTTTGAINDLDFSNADLIVMNNASLSTIQGLKAGTNGQRVTIVSVGAGQVDLAPQNAGSAAANRLVNIATVQATSLAAGLGNATYIYDGNASRWKLYAHNQGGVINYTPTWGGFSTAPTGGAAYFILNGGIVYIWVNSWTQGTSNATTTTISLPYQSTGSADVMGGITHAMDNGAFSDSPGRIDFRGAQATCDLYKGLSTLAWTASGGKVVDFYAAYRVG